MRKITIGIVTPYSLNMYGGVQNIALALGEGLSKHGVDIVYLSPDKEYISPYQHICIGRSIRLPNLNGSWSEVSYPTLSKKQVVDIIKSHKIDLLHFQEILSPASCWSVMRHSTVPNIISFHASWKQNIFIDLYLMLIRKILSHLYVKTITSSKVSAKSNSILLKNNVVIHPSINLPKTKHQQSPDNKMQSLIFVGRLEKRKGVLDLIEAYNNLSSETQKWTRLIIVGDGPEKQNIINDINRLKLTEKITLYGKTNNNKRNELIQYSTVLIAPSTYGESFGLILIEALALGCPVIASNNDGYCNTLKEYPHPEYIVNVKNHLEFAHKIESLLQQKNVRNEIIDWAKVWIKQFDPTVVARQHLRIYRQILNLT